MRIPIDINIMISKGNISFVKVAVKTLTHLFSDLKGEIRKIAAMPAAV
jgi:hypothetical protein